MSVVHTLDDGDQLSATSQRLRRARGQFGAVVRMPDDDASCKEIVTQTATVNKALNTVACTLISASLKECLADQGSENTLMTEKFQKLFLSLA